ncbi:hypothetical protein J5N97_004663 [Dioscorea zingiberensis]|uniref:Uncharacterized protein n=1 Tax=Dioscorea zingiberensis TaxID=325984 RepID=A0A9D5D8V9_9LILI|nr:hypothetical protein J5N97_004663 [Dioscorea zingiberensis]
MHASDIRQAKRGRGQPACSESHASDRAGAPQRRCSTPPKGERRGITRPCARPKNREGCWACRADATAYCRRRGRLEYPHRRVFSLHSEYESSPDFRGRDGGVAASTSLAWISGNGSAPSHQSPLTSSPPRVLHKNKGRPTSRRRTSLYLEPTDGLSSSEGEEAYCARTRARRRRRKHLTSRALVLKPGELHILHVRPLNHRRKRAHLRDRHTLSLLFALCDHGVEPEALAAPSVTFPSPPNHRCSSSSHQSLALGPFSQTIATAAAFSILYGAPNPWIQKEEGRRGRGS